MLSDDTVFMTGFPGFIASRLLRQLAPNGKRFLLLIQPAFAKLAAEEVKVIAADSKRSLSDFTLLPGDITEPDLGLSGTNLEVARAESTLLFHLAAFYDLAVKREPAMRVNVQGTTNVNRFASMLPRLEHYHYVSTCYVAGKRKGSILETELAHTAGFRNHYEETKYLAEMSVENLKAELPLTIHRPSVVCGDSKTGETAKYDGIYYLIRYLLKWPWLLSTFNIGNEDVTLNLVPVDFVVEAMASLARDSHAIGKTIQLADPRPLTTRKLFDTITRCINGRGSRVTVPAQLVQFSLMLPVSPAISGLPHSAVPYFFLKQTYDSTQARALLDPKGISCPPFETYAETIVDYATRHAQLS